MKRMLGIVLILIVLAAFTPLVCFAENITCNPNGQDLDMLFKLDGEYSLTGDESSCFLKDITLTTGKITLDLNRKNLTVNSVKCPDYYSQCSLEIIGPGTLNVSDSIEINNDLTISGGTVTADIGIVTLNGNVTIDGGNVTAAYNSLSAASGTVTILKGSVVNASIFGNNIDIQGGTVIATNYNRTMNSFHAKNNLTISDGEVKATATGMPGAYVIDSEGSITITGGRVTAIGDSSNNGITAQSITISGGTVTASGGSPIYATQGDINISGGTVTANSNIYSNLGDVTISGGQVSASTIEARYQSIKLGWDKPTDFIHAGTYIASNGTIEALKPFSAFATDQITGEPEKTIEAGNVDANEINGKWLRNQAMELPVEITVVQGNGEKGVPEDVKAQTISLTIRLKQNGELKLSSAPIELAVTPGGNREPAEFDAVKFTPNTPDFKESCGNYEYEVTVTPKEVKADIAGAGDDGPAYLLRASAGSPDCEKFVLTLYWNSKTAASEPEVIRVVALPEDEIGAYQLRADGTKEYLLFQTYDICMTYLGRDELCRGPERCYHK